MTTILKSRPCDSLRLIYYLQ